MSLKKTYAVYYVELGDADEDQAVLDLRLEELKGLIEYHMDLPFHLEDIIVAPKRK